MSGTAAPPHAGADILIRNAKVITCDRAFRIARAIALKDGRVLAVGDDAALAPLSDGETTVIDAGGHAVIPGLIDCHAHMDREGLKPVFPSLAGCRSIDDVLQRIAQLVAASEPGAWIVTMPIGEPPYYWDVPGNLREKRFPTRWELDRVSPKNPVYIRPIWGYWRHIIPISSVANSLALEAAGIHPGMAPPPATIRFETDPATGAFNGIIHEDTFMPAAELGYFHMMPRFEHGHRVRGLRDAMRIYNATGTTSIYEEHGCAQELIQAYQSVRAAGDMAVRASLVFSPSWHFIRAEQYAPTLQRWAAWLGKGGLGDDWLRVEGMYVEPGITPENLLRINASPYTGWSGFNYDCGLPRERLVDLMCEAARNDIRVAAITIDFLDLFEEVDRRVPIAGKRWVLGHLRTATADQVRRIRALGLAMSAHTNRYVFKEGHLIRDEIGRARENEIAPLRALVEEGVHIGLATDNVPTSLFWPVWEAVTRYNRYADDAIAPGQALTREQALRCATIEGAHLTFEEDVKGSLEPGKYADLAILSDDPLTCSDDALKDIVALKTIVGGRVVYERDEASAAP
jgi:predicted amidohydrolase YtcJ